MQASEDANNSLKRFVNAHAIGVGFPYLRIMGLPTAFRERYRGSRFFLATKTYCLLKNHISMKEKGTGKYAIVLFVTIFFVEIVLMVVDVIQGSNVLPYGIGAEMLSILLKTAIDFVVALLISIVLEIVLKKFTEKTFLPNLVLTVVIYFVISMLV